MARFLNRPFFGACIIAALSASYSAISVIAAEPKEATAEQSAVKEGAAAKEEAIERLFERARPSLAVITTEGRNGADASARSHASHVSVWTVFPRPMSSARTPPKLFEVR